jgi:hypothetical protein
MRQDTDRSVSSYLPNLSMQHSTVVGHFPCFFNEAFWRVNVLYFVLRLPLGKSWARCQEYAYVIGRYGNGLRT